MTDTRNYLADARSDAAEMAASFADEIVEQITDDGEASTDLYNDYHNADAYHHENHVDRSYDLIEAAALLDQLDDYEETDHGLWDGLEPRRAIGAQAAYTYGNAVYALWREIIEEINADASDGIIGDMLADKMGADHIRARVLEIIRDF